MPLTPEDRQKGADNSLTQRRKEQQKRREQAKGLFESGMSKTKIAEELGVKYWTIWNDLRQE